MPNFSFLSLFVTAQVIHLAYGALMVQMWRRHIVTRCLREFIESQHLFYYVCVLIASHPLILQFGFIGAACANGTTCVTPRADTTVGVCSHGNLLPAGADCTTSGMLLLVPQVCSCWSLWHHQVLRIAVYAFPSLSALRSNTSSGMMNQSTKHIC